MSSYVNLIQPSEIKYHSVATDKRALLRIGFLLMVLFGLYGGWTVWTSLRGTREARAIQQEWETVKPLHAEAVRKSRAEKQVQATRACLESWGSSRLPVASFLVELALLLPDTVQATQMELTSRLAGLDGAAGRVGAGDIKVPERLYQLQFKGLSHGPDGEKVVFQLVDQIKKSTAMAAWIASVKLQDAHKEFLKGPELVAAAEPATPPLPAAALTEEQLFGKPASPGAGAPAPAPAKEGSRRTGNRPPRPPLPSNVNSNPAP